MAHCPKCKSKDLRRSRTRSRWERWRKAITDNWPFRCRACQWRGWLPMSATALEQVAAQRRNATDPPNLRGTLLARSNPRHRLDLHTLDQFDRDDEKDA